MIRTPIDIVINRGVYAFELHEGSTPWSTDDLWLAMALAVILTGATWQGQGALEGDEINDILGWGSAQGLLPRAAGRVVENRRLNKKTEFLVDAVVVAAFSDLEMRSNPKWWHKALRAIMSNSSLDYPLDFIEVDPDTNRRCRLPAY
jgi:hypothetical protein